MASVPFRFLGGFVVVVSGFLASRCRRSGASLGVLVNPPALEVFWFLGGVGQSPGVLEVFW